MVQTRSNANVGTGVPQQGENSATGGRHPPITTGEVEALIQRVGITTEQFKEVLAALAPNREVVVGDVAGGPIGEKAGPEEKRKKLEEEDESSSFERMSAFDRLGDPKSKKPRTSAFERLQDTRSARKGDLRDTLKEKRGESTATSKVGSEERQKKVGDKGAAELWKMYEQLEKRLDAQNPYRQAVFSEVTPFSRRIMSCPLPDNFKTPQIKAYNGTTDPQDHLARFEANVVMYAYPEEIKCRCFLATLEGQACEWFHKLPKGSIDKWGDLAHKFLEHFASSRRQKLPFSHLLNVKIRKGEQLREFINRWEKEARDVQGADDQALIAMLQAALPQGDVRKELRRNPLSTYQEMLARAKYLALEEEDDEPPVRKEKKSGPPVAEGKKRKEYGKGPNPTGYHANRHPVHAVQSLPAPPHGRESYGVQDAPKYCEYHRNSTHNTSECVTLKKEMDQLIARGPPPRSERPSTRISPRAVSSVLVREEEGAQRPVYYVARVLRGAELRYTNMEKTIFAVVCTVKKLTPYFQAHPVHVLSQIPIGTLLRSPNAPSRVSKWGVFLGSFQIEFKPRPAIKGQALADFVVECTAREVESSGEEPEGNWWTVYTDGSSATDASGGGVVAISPEGFKAYYSVRFRFKVSNNEAEYEALLCGLRLAASLKAERIQVRCDSKLVVGHVTGEFEAKDERMKKYRDTALELLKAFGAYRIEQVPREENAEADILSKLGPDSPDHIKAMTQEEEFLKPSISPGQVLIITLREEPDWIDEITMYILDGSLPIDPIAAKVVRRRAPSYTLECGRLYKRSYNGTLLRCFRAGEAQKLMEEIHEGICSAHQGAFTMSRKVTLQGYFWPTIIRDCAEYVRKCKRLRIRTRGFLLHPRANPSGLPGRSRPRSALSATMGRVRTKTVKKSSRQVIERYYSRFTLDFHTNKKVLEEVAIIPSKRLRNKIAGFSTHLMKRIQKGPVRGISLKLQEEERERRMDFVPEQSAINTDVIQVDKETMDLLTSLGIADLPGVVQRVEETAPVAAVDTAIAGGRGGFGAGRPGFGRGGFGGAGGDRY
ncbi:unnamed protein product [Cuscuta campestris]|uniref:RNase H type-1 domain-containing protein n=3 Tax=Cuscuta sect. Cleistogrammica TaxID=1824901 RepID=A0A484MB56_9ASTE|nr:unnamed protein product [Cuscuta campestris]